MLDKFKEYINKENLLKTNSKVLLALSGGIDSITMAHLFVQLGTSCTIAHCNFQLRGKESDQDEAFVLNFANQHGIPFECIRFNTKEYAHDNKLSIQMAARELRYNWFAELLNQKKLNATAIAHNMNDLVETFHINMIRGSGLHGLCAFIPKQGNLIRPLLFATRNQIHSYAAENNLEFRTDSSNAETKYLRNAVRHNIIPEFEKLNHNYLLNSQHTIHILQSIRSFLLDELQKLKSKLITHQNQTDHIKIEELIQSKLSTELLFELLSEYNFNFSTICNIQEALKTNVSGLQFYSNSHELLINRKELLLRIKQTVSFTEYLIEEGTTSISHPVQMEISILKKPTTANIPKEKHVVALDADKLKFPLKIRKWIEGDKFIPLGMKGHKKLSDFFIDEKLSLFEKENTLLLISDEKIAWVINHRISDEFKIKNNTSTAIILAINS